jgi:hypothetical protein
MPNRNVIKRLEKIEEARRPKPLLLWIEADNDERDAEAFDRFLAGADLPEGVKVHFRARELSEEEWLEVYGTAAAPRGGDHEKELLHRWSFPLWKGDMLFVPIGKTWADVAPRGWQSKANVEARS